MLIAVLVMLGVWGGVSLASSCGGSGFDSYNCPQYNVGEGDAVRTDPNYGQLTITGKTTISITTGGISPFDWSTAGTSINAGVAPLEGLYADTSVCVSGTCTQYNSSQNTDTNYVQTQIGLQISCPGSYTTQGNSDHSWTNSNGALSFSGSTWVQSALSC